MWKEAVMAYLMIVSQYMSQGTEKNCKKSETEQQSPGWHWKHRPPPRNLITTSQCLIFDFWSIFISFLIQFFSWIKWLPSSISCHLYFFSFLSVGAHVPQSYNNTGAAIILYVTEILQNFNSHQNYLRFLELPNLFFRQVVWFYVWYYLLNKMFFHWLPCPTWTNL